MRKEDPTDAESAFFHRLALEICGAQDWYHRDPDGALWMIASVDVVSDEGVTTTWRCDYDGRRLLAGRSPANLNWDDGVRATDAGISGSGPMASTSWSPTLAEPETLRPLGSRRDLPPPEATRLAA